MSFVIDGKKVSSEELAPHRSGKGFRRLKICKVGGYGYDKATAKKFGARVMRVSFLMVEQEKNMAAGILSDFGITDCDIKDIRAATKTELNELGRGQ